MSETTEMTTDQLSRRSLLKKLGVGTAVAWTAPMLATVEASAGLSTGAPNQGAACRDLARHGNIGEPFLNSRTCSICDPPFCNSNNQCSSCFCRPEVQRQCCFCAADLGSTCENDNCSRNGQCPPGWACVYVCDCPIPIGFKGKCVPPCGFNCVNLRFQ